MPHPQQLPKNEGVPAIDRVTIDVSVTRSSGDGFGGYMRLSWNEIRTRAARFTEEWKGKGYERGETQTFYNEFFEVFGVPLKRVASFEEPVKLLGAKRGFIDLFWKGLLLVEQKSAGRSLSKAKTQAFNYFPGLKDADLPRFLLLSDFQTFELYDLEEGGEFKFTLGELPKYVEAFGFILGVQKRTFLDQDPVNIKASELMGKLHDALKTSGYVGHDLERLLVRLLFCLFADDTGIFDVRGSFDAMIRERTREDGSDLGAWLTHLFEVLNTPKDKRQTSLDDDLAQFEYVNGDLFSERLPIPACNAAMRKQLLEACEFQWDAISPAIFGALFQSVMLPKERRQQGAHYTTEKNILKLIQPLFLDELRTEFERLKARRDTRRHEALETFHAKLSALRFLDPACGCGNFLIITYRELRQLEIDLLKEIHADVLDRLTGGVAVFNVASFSKLDVDQFYGIEISEFPARIAEVALWMMDHIMNNRLSVEFGQNYARIPLKKAPHIHPSDALEMDWAAVLPPDQCSYLFGNPPFLGAKYQSELQRSQVRRIACLGGFGGTLDFVTAWLLKAGEYVQQGRAKIAFVATNSITQGEQVAQLWPLLFERYELEIAFAHRTFAWGSDARGKAHVHVVIIGLTQHDQEPTIKRLFSYDNISGDPTQSQHKALTPYLFDAGTVINRHLVVRETSKAINGAPKMIIGSKPIDGGYLIFDDTEKVAFLTKEPGADKFFRPYIGGVEYLQGRSRWILALQKASPQELRSLPHVKERLECVKKYRLGEIPARKKVDAGEIKKPGISARALAATPAEFHVTVIPENSFLAVPENSSETRDYVPIGWLNPPTIPSNKLRFISNTDLYQFGLMTSRMHVAWLRYVGGRIKSDFQYSVGVVYNTFPWPDTVEVQKTNVRKLAQAILDARAKFPDAALADLYDTTVMKPELRRAHQALDAAVDKLYRGATFASDRDRVEHLFGVYEKLTAPLMAGPTRLKRKRSA